MRQRNKRLVVAIVAIVIVAMMLLSLLLPVLSAGAASYEDLNNKYADLQKQLKQIEQQKKSNNQQLDENEKKEEDLKQKKAALDSSIGVIRQQISILNTQVNENQKQIGQLSDNIAKTQQSIDRNTQLYRERVRVLYEAGGVSKLEVLLASKSVTDFLTRFEIVRMISKHDNELLDELKNEKKQIESEKAALEKTRAQLSAKRRDTLAKQADLNSRSLQSAQYLAQLSALDGKIRSANSQLDSQKEDVQDDLEAASREIEEFLNAQKKAGHNAGQFSGQFIWPASGPVTCGYGGYAGHTGMDIGGTSGVTPIRAAAAGTVIRVGYWNKSIPRSSAGYGNYVLLDNGTDQNGNSIATVYAHMYDNTIRVSVGQKVEQGQVIGTMGNSGNVRSGGVSPPISDLVRGAHLHFEIRINGKTVNPANYLG